MNLKGTSVKISQIIQWKCRTELRDASKIYILEALKIYPRRKKVYLKGIILNCNSQAWIYQGQHGPWPRVTNFLLFEKLENRLKLFVILLCSDYESIHIPNNSIIDIHLRFYYCMALLPSPSFHVFIIFFISRISLSLGEQQFQTASNFLCIWSLIFVHFVYYSLLFRV